MTEMTIRKAHGMGKSAVSLALLGADRLELEIEITVFDKDAPKTLHSNQDLLRQRIQGAQQLILAAYQLRALVGEANARAGQQPLVSKLRALELEQKLLAKIGGVEDEDTGRYNPRREGIVATEHMQAKLDFLRKQLDKPEARLAYGAGVEDTISVSLLEPADREKLTQRLGAIKTERLAIQDELAQIGLRQVNVPDKLLEIFKRYHLAA